MTTRASKVLRDQRRVVADLRKDGVDCSLVFICDDSGSIVPVVQVHTPTLPSIPCGTLGQEIEMYLTISKKLS